MVRLTGEARARAGSKQYEESEPETSVDRGESGRKTHGDGERRCEKGVMVGYSITAESIESESDAGGVSRRASHPAEAEAGRGGVSKQSVFVQLGRSELRAESAVRRETLLLLLLVRRHHH